MKKLLCLIVLLSACAAWSQTNIGCVTFGWTDPNPPGAVESYYFYHSTNYSLPLTNWTKIAIVQGGVTNIPVNIPAGYHWFFVTCSNAWSGETVPSNIASTNVPSLLGPITNLQIISLIRTNGF